MASERILKSYGNYFLFDRVAEGGMADVFRARKISEGGEGRLLVIKRIRPEVAGEPGFKEMFKSEARVLTRLNHPNIVQLHEFGEFEDLPFLAMEYLQGRTLGEILVYLRKMNFRLPLEFVIGIAEQVARGLHYAHALKDPVTGEWMGVVHRDITPENIFVCWDGTVKLIDFGIVKATTNVERTVTGFMKGKPAYLSPEYLIGDPVDGRADIFALGAVMWEMVAGKQVFLGASDPATVKNVLEMMPAPLVTYNPETPPELEDIVCKALDKDPMHRYRTAEEMERQIHGLLVRVARNFVPSDLGNWVLKIFRSEVEEDSQRLRDMDAEYMMTNLGTGSLKLGDQQTGASFTPALMGEVRSKHPLPPPFEPGKISLTSSSGGPKLEVIPAHEFVTSMLSQQAGSVPPATMTTPPPVQRPASLQAPAPPPGAAVTPAPAPPAPAVPQAPPVQQQSGQPMFPQSPHQPPPSTMQSQPAPVQLQPGPNWAPSGGSASLNIPNLPPDYYRREPASPWQWMILGGLLVAGGMYGVRYIMNYKAAEKPVAVASATPRAPSPTPSPSAATEAVENAPEPKETKVPDEPADDSDEPETPVARANPVQTARPAASARVVAPAKPKTKSILLRIKVMPEGETFSAWVNDIQLNPKKPELMVPLDQIVKIVVKSPGYKNFQFKVLADSETLGDAPYWLLNVRLQQKRREH